MWLIIRIGLGKLIILVREYTGQNLNQGTLDKISIRKLVGEGISPINPQTSIISSTEVAGKRSSWKADKTFPLAYKKIKKNWLIFSVNSFFLKRLWIFSVKSFFIKKYVISYLDKYIIIMPNPISQGRRPISLVAWIGNTDKHFLVQLID